MFATVIERCLLPDHGLHPAYSGREFRILDIQFDIDRKLPSATVRAQIVGTRNFHPPPRRACTVVLLVIELMYASRSEITRG